MKSISFSTIVLFVATTNFCVAQQAFYDVTAANGNGIRFWSDNNYKIHMGYGSEYFYGPVQDFSIKMNMNAGSSYRGWTWGVNGATPIAALSSQGYMQIAGSLTAQGLSLDRGTWPYVIFSENGTAGARIQGVGGQFAITTTDGGTNLMVVNSTSGNVGIGTSSPSNTQNYVKVLDVSGSTDSKIIATASSQAYRTGIYSNSSWNGGGGFVGTESNHNLYFITNYLTKMTLGTNGNLGLGVTNPAAKIDASVSNMPVLVSRGNTSSYAGGDIYLERANTTASVGRGINIEMNDVGSGSHTMIQTSSAGIQFLNVNGGSGWLETMRITNNGNIGIGSTSPNQKLTVNGTIYGKEVKVDLSVPGPDYVFEKSYSLPTIDQVKSYIDQNKHLPEVPSAAEMEKNGINLSEMNMLLLKKVEELTLYVIELKKENEMQQADIVDLRKAVTKK